MLHRRLTEDDWLYHVFHLAEHDADRRDCAICAWYHGLAPRTQALYDLSGSKL